ncbi:VapE domain-containing protein [Maribellus sediminis]|uniref:VapE domain-containing protein n=1 Tax=Maribellus sediminis TaxID=2696285 RepID=UPI0014307F10|nr:VapE domain-containing protein [Maribellus sediminis]
MKEHKPLVLNKGQFMTEVERTLEDCLNWAREILEQAAEDIGKQSDAMMLIVEELTHYDNPIKTKRYCDLLAEEFNLRKSDFDELIKEVKRIRLQESKEENDESALISRAEAFISDNYEIKFNVVSNRFVCRDLNNSKVSDLNIDNVYRKLRKEHVNIPMGDLKSLLRSDFIPKYNPFGNYFDSLSSWDGEDHISKLASYIKVKGTNNSINDRARFENMFRKMLVRSVACSLEKDFNKHCFTLVHDKQSSGKTTFLRWLCPSDLSDYYTENIGLTKDDMIALTENFVINIDELSVLSKYDINQLKSLLSKDKIKIRLPYADRPENLQRRCNFVASTNNLEFLHDETGSVRWICFLLDRINWNYKNEIDINLVWTQAYHLFQNGFDYQLTSMEIKENEEANKFFFIRSPELEIVQKYFRPGNKNLFERYPEAVKFMTATDIISYLSNELSPSLKFYKANIGKALTMLGFSQSSKYEKDRGMSIKGYYVVLNKVAEDEMYSGINWASNPVDDNGELPF